MSASIANMERVGVGLVLGAALASLVFATVRLQGGERSQPAGVTPTANSAEHVPAPDTHTEHMHGSPAGLAGHEDHGRPAGDRSEHGAPRSVPAEHSSHDQMPAPSTGVPARAAGMVHLSPQKQQLIGVRAATVGYKTLTKTIRAVGKVDLDERRISHIHTKIEGWIEDLFVNYTGKYVASGQPLLTIYSPDLVSAQEEYLLALRTANQMTQGNLLAPGTDLRSAARRRLSYWDIGEGEIRSLEQRGQPRRAITLYTHQGGNVLEKKALAGMRVMPGDDLFTIADLSVVWVHAQVYAYELPYVRVGQAADVTLNYLPGKTFRGRVVYIYPTLDPSTRTARMRVELANPGLQLKPEMYATVLLKTPSRRYLAVPTEAVLDSGERQIAFVVRPGGYFEPRPLKSGGQLGDYTIVTSGLEPGERVVTSANFLIDSESQLQSAMVAMSGHQH